MSRNISIRKKVKVILTEELVPQVRALKLRYSKDIQKGIDVKLSLTDAEHLIDFINLMNK